MVTVVNTPPGSSSGDTTNTNSMGLAIAVIAIIAILLLLFFYGLPFLRQTSEPVQQPAQQPGIEIPDEVDVNVNTPK